MDQPSPSHTTTTTAARVGTQYVSQNRSPLTCQRSSKSSPALVHLRHGMASLIFFASLSIISQGVSHR